MINFSFWGFTLVVYVSHKVNVHVTDIILNITSQEHLIFISLHIGSRLFELFSKEVRVKKQSGMPLKQIEAKRKDVITQFLLGSIQNMWLFMHFDST